MPDADRQVGEVQERGLRIRAARVYANLEQQTLAGLLDVHPTTLKSWESGRRRAPEEQLRAVVLHTGVPAWFLEAGWDGWQQLPGVQDDPAARESVEQRLERLEREMRQVRGTEGAAAAATRAVRAAPKSTPEAPERSQPNRRAQPG